MSQVVFVLGADLMLKHYCKMKTLRDILKNVPIGTKLWCDICGEVILQKVKSNCYAYPIHTITGNDSTVESGFPMVFDEHGRYDVEINYDKIISTPDCVLWPDKNTRTWDNYQLPIRKELSKPAIISPNLKQFLEENTDYYEYTKGKHMNTVLKWLREIHGIYVGVEVIKEVSPSEEGIEEVNIFYKPCAYSEIKDERRLFCFSTNNYVRAAEVAIIETIKYFILRHNK